MYFSAALRFLKRQNVIKAHVKEDKKDDRAAAKRQTGL